MVGKIKYKGKWYPYDKYKARSFIVTDESGKEFEVANDDIEDSFKLGKHYTIAEWAMLRGMSVEDVNEYLTLRDWDRLEIFWSTRNIKEIRP